MLYGNHWLPSAGHWRSKLRRLFSNGWEDAEEKFLVLQHGRSLGVDVSPKTPCHKAGKTKRSKRQHVQLVQLWLGLPPKVAGKAYENCKEIGDDDPLRRGANQTSALSAPEGRPSKCLDGPCFSSPSRLFPLMHASPPGRWLQGTEVSPKFPRFSKDVRPNAHLLWRWLTGLWTSTGAVGGANLPWHSS